MAKGENTGVRERKREMFYLTTHSTHFIPQTGYHSLCYTSRGALAGTRNSSMGPPHEGSIRRPIAPWANALPLSYVPLPTGVTGWQSWQLWQPWQPWPSRSRAWPAVEVKGLTTERITSKSGQLVCVCMRTESLVLETNRAKGWHRDVHTLKHNVIGILLLLRTLANSYHIVLAKGIWLHLLRF